MAKVIQKKQKVGCALFINRTGGVGASSWERSGFTFKTSGEAVAYKNKHHSTVNKFRVEGVRLNIEPIKASAGRGEKAES